MPNKLNINRATKEELCQLDGVAATTAKRILAYRKHHGHFKSINDLAHVKGISHHKLQKMKPYIFCSFKGEASLLDKFIEEFKTNTSTTTKRSKKTYKTKPVTFSRKKEARKILFEGGKKLKESDLQEAAADLRIDLACIKAVIEVESSGGGFLSNGKAKILFEGHVFWRQLLKRGIAPERFASQNRNILYNKWTRSHYLSGWAEYRRLQKAKLIHKEAALESASWGMFQIMGFNYRLAGFKSVEQFVQSMEQSEKGQLQAFINFIKNKGLVTKLQRRDWAGFAKAYNGPAYKKNKYDTKLANAYRRYKSLVR